MSSKEDWLLISYFLISTQQPTLNPLIHVGMDEMYESAQQAKHRFLGIVEEYKICNGWNVQNWPIYCKFWIWILPNLSCLSCMSIKFALVVKPTLILLFWLFGLCLYIWLFNMCESFYAIIHKIGLYTLLLRYEREYF